MKKLGVLVTLTSALLVGGCELIVDFDRTKIAGEEIPETGVPDAPAVDSATDDASADATSDAPADAGSDADAADAADDVADASDSG